MKLNVFTKINNESWFVGILDARPGDGEFIYNPDWLKFPDAFPVDPIHLPLKSGVFKNSRSSGLFGAFEDSLPDDWGKRLLIRRHHLPGRVTPVELLKVMGAETMGGLMYSETEFAPQKENFSSPTLEQLLNAIEKFEQNPDADDQHQFDMLFQAGSSPGGARPKVLIVEEQGGNYIAKFPSIRDEFSICQWEAASLDIAEAIGLVVPNRRLIHIGTKTILLIERFDLSDRSRRHMLSFQTLLDLDQYYYASYGDIKNILAQYSPSPKKEIEHLFRQMVFNAALGNTDDHLKNFSAFILQQTGLTMTPVYDVIPNLMHNREHVLNFDLDPWTPDLKVLKKLGRSWGVSKPESIIVHILETFNQHWKSFCEKRGVPEVEWDRMFDDGRRRRSIMCR